MLAGLSSLSVRSRFTFDLPSIRLRRTGEITGDHKDRRGGVLGPLIARARPQSAAAFQRANAPFELGEVSRARKVFIIAALFDAFEPASNRGEKEGKHNHLQEVAYQ
jgi:hypothetical protein